MIELECFENLKSTLRLSLRGAGSPQAIKNIYQIILLYLSV